MGDAKGSNDVLNVVELIIHMNPLLWFIIFIIIIYIIITRDIITVTLSFLITVLYSFKSFNGCGLVEEEQEVDDECYCESSNLPFSSLVNLLT